MTSKNACKQAYLLLWLMRVLAIVYLSWWHLIDPVKSGNYLGYCRCSTSSGVAHRLSHARKCGAVLRVGRAQRKEREREAEACPLAEPQENDPKGGCGTGGDKQAQSASASQGYSHQDDAVLRRPSVGEHGGEKHRRGAHYLREREHPPR